MRVLLAGFNVDTEILARLRAEILEPIRERWEESRLDGLGEGALREQAATFRKRAAEFLARDHLTPEPISAAYARISRDPRPLDALRADAREEVERARRSNRTIIFEYGHSSVAEHACFNFDVMGVSRYAVEEIEKFRLLSYTEKSQRYILLEDDFVLPREIAEAGLSSRFVETIRAQNACYHRLYAKLRPWVFEHNPEMAASRKHHKTLEGWAKEDARYVVSLATEAQLGMTLNARGLEHVLSRCASHPLAEIREYARRLHEVVEGVAPSLVRYIEPTEYHARARPELAGASEAVFSSAEAVPPAPPLGREGDVSLIDVTPEADALVAAALLHSSSGRPMADCRAAARAMDKAALARFIADTFRHMRTHDSVLREFENVRCVFEVILSAACFGQFKRHRMATLNTQPYDPTLGVTLPPSIAEAGAEREFRAAIEETDALHARIAECCPHAAPYVLTNAHRRRILFTANARELYHVSRLREDPHSQWDIREKAAAMLRLARGAMPATLQFAVGKHQAAEQWARLFPEEKEKGESP